VVLYFPDHSLLSPSQDQHGHSARPFQDRFDGLDHDSRRGVAI
jgi:hypothetical protein